MTTLIKNCRIIDGISDSPLERGFVLLKDEKIAAIGQGDPNIQADKTIDAGSGFLLPGLINLHVHINRRHLSRADGVFRKGAPYVENSSDAKRMVFAAKNAWYALSQGITTLRDACSVGRTAGELKACINEGLIPGPRLIVCGLGIAATGGHETHRYKGAVEADGPVEVMKAVRHEIKMGADFIKLMVSGGLGGMPEHEHPDWTEMDVEEIKAATSAAHSHKRDVTVHAMGEGPVMNALMGGVDGIEHGAVLTDRALDMMKQRNVYYVPTMSGIKAVADKEEQSGSRQLAKLIRDIVADPQRESVEKAYKKGIMIGAGSDTLGSLHSELKLFTECGMSKMQAIQTATRNAAKILRMDDMIGTIEEGKTADLLLVKNNPLESLDALLEVERVFLSGNEVQIDLLIK